MSLLVAACGGTTGTAATSTTVPVATTSTNATTTTVDPITTTTSAPATTTSTAATTTTSGSPSATWAGQEVELGPGEGDVLMVIGVRYDDVLNLRAGPGANQAIRDTIPPTYTDLVALGRTWELPSSFWIEVDYDGTDGWVHASYFAYEGATNDDTANVVSQLGETPTKSQMTALGLLVADLYATDDLFNEVVQVTEATSGDLSEIIYDVVGLADDSVGGVRIHVFAEEGSGGFTLKTVETTTLCSRGVDEDGICA